MRRDTGGDQEIECIEVHRSLAEPSTEAIGIDQNAVDSVLALAAHGPAVCCIETITGDSKIVSWTRTELARWSVYGAVSRAEAIEQAVRNRSGDTAVIVPSLTRLEPWPLNRKNDANRPDGET
jgi:hypothetical protein